jgi:hypothetical protein
MRDELLNETLFFDLAHARAALARWVADYNQHRPHSALRYQTPAAFAATFTATGDRPSNPDQLRRSPVAPPRSRATLTPRLWPQPDEQRGSGQADNTGSSPSFRHLRAGKKRRSSLTRNKVAI